MLSARTFPLNDTQVSCRWTIDLVAQGFGTASHSTYNKDMNKTTYEITCPALGETETTTDLDRAMDLCFSMHDESDSYAFIRDSFGDIVGEYGDIMQAVSDHLV